MVTRRRASKPRSWRGWACRPRRSPQDVEVAHDGLVDFLDGAPADLRVWARAQIGSIDEAFALLSDPTIDRSAVRRPGARARRDSAAGRHGHDRSPPRSAGRRRGHRTVHSGSHDRQDRADQEGPGPNRGRDRPGGGAGPVPSAAGPPDRSVRGRGRRGRRHRHRRLQPQRRDRGPGDQRNARSGGRSERRRRLREGRRADDRRSSADPKDIASLQSLADIYYGASDYETAGAFLEKIIAVDPKDVTARLALGAALFNLGQTDDAEEQWRAVLALEPNNLEAHYDLGFMYLSQTPPDLAKVRAEWGKVIDDRARLRRREDRRAPTSPASMPRPPPARRPCRPAPAPRDGPDRAGAGRLPGAERSMTR